MQGGGGGGAEVMLHVGILAKHSLEMLEQCCNHSKN